MGVPASVLVSVTILVDAPILVSVFTSTVEALLLVKASMLGDLPKLDEAALESDRTCVVGTVLVLQELEPPVVAIRTWIKESGIVRKAYCHS